MSTTHYENANFLRELAENLPRILPTGSADKAELLQRLADDELTQAEYDDRVRAKVAAARADTRLRLTTEQVRQRLQTRYPEATAASSAKFLRGVPLCFLPGRGRRFIVAVMLVVSHSFYIFFIRSFATSEGDN